MGVPQVERDRIRFSLALEASGRKVDARAIRLRGRERVETIARRIGDEDLRRRFLRDVIAHQKLGVDEDVTVI